MNRNEALRLLGLSEDATSEEVKAAYRETAQILHPDRFATNKKLQERATEQFKNLQEAYEVLMSGKAQVRPSAKASSPEEMEINARLAGISAARKQLLTQRDVALDERRSGLAMAGIGALVALAFGRKLGVLAVVASIGVACAVWGIVKVVSAQKTASILNDHLDELAAEKKELLSRLDEIA
mgnify:FL=1